MPRRYFKRYRMEYDLERQEPPAAVLPDGFKWVDWNDTTLEQHAVVKFRAFQGTVDADVFPSLATFSGCLSLMKAITGRVDFLPRATHLVVATGLDALGPVPVGTIQSVAPIQQRAAIQNLGVVPEVRGYGLGRALIARSLIAMRAHGYALATLEVTARNDRVVEMYRRLGFCKARTSYRSVKVTRQQSALLDTVGVGVSR